MRILLIEPDSKHRDSIKEMLVNASMQVHTAETGDEGWSIARHCGTFDLTVADTALPDMSVFDLIRSIRAVSRTLPIIVTAAATCIKTKMRSFETGADGVITKPLEPRELVATVLALTRRAYGHASSIISIGEISVDISKRAVFFKDTRLSLTQCEYAVLETLALHGCFVPLEIIEDSLYNDPGSIPERIIYVLTHRIRMKLKAAGCRSTTVKARRGFGYAIFCS